MNNSFDINSQINNAINSRGNIVHEVINQNVALLTAKISQSGITIPIMVIMDQNFASTVTLTFTYVGVGIYTLTASEPIFGDTADKFYSENTMYFDSGNLIKMLSFIYSTPTEINLESFDIGNVPKEIDQDYIPFKLYVYPS